MIRIASELIMKKKFFVIIIILSIFFSIAIYKLYKNSEKKCSDITYAIDHYFKTGMFNKYKMNNINTIFIYKYTLDSSQAEVCGKDNNIPHETVKYKVYLTKDTRKNKWNIKEISRE